MWCLQCQQDVPAAPTNENEGFCCPRCGGEFDIGQTGFLNLLPADDGWEWDEHLRQIERELKSEMGNEVLAATAGPFEALRFDLPGDVKGWHVPSVRPDQGRKDHGARRGFLSKAVTWTALSAGTAAFVCGAILLSWSILTGREDLWTVGLPVALTGQLALVVGLVLQLDRLGHDNRRAAAKLDTVDAQLDELKTATKLLNTSQGSATGVFYSHLASGAAPHLLLTDLKKQLDLLALKIERERR